MSNFAENNLSMKFCNLLDVDWCWFNPRETFTFDSSISLWSGFRLAPDTFWSLFIVVLVLVKSDAFIFWLLFSPEHRIPHFWLYQVFSHSCYHKYSYISPLFATDFLFVQVLCCFASLTFPRRSCHIHQCVSYSPFLEKKRIELS